MQKSIPNDATTAAGSWDSASVRGWAMLPLMPMSQCDAARAPLDHARHPNRRLAKALHAGWRAQWNGTPLIPQDRFAIGSRYTVRGFDGAFLLLGDRGWVLRQELGLSVPTLRSELYTGIDTGKIGGRSAEDMLGNRLTGAVIGLRGSAARVSWDLFLGRPLSKPEGFRSASTTAGFHLSLNF